MFDEAALARQLAEYAARHAEQLDSAGESVAAAVAALAAVGEDWRAWAQRIASAHAMWLVGSPLESVDFARPAPQIAPAYTVVATDGSQIAPDRHEVAPCWLVNTSRITFRYGSEHSQFVREVESLVLGDDEPGDEDWWSEIAPGRRVAFRRQLEEMRHLGRLIEQEASAGVPVVALVDGTLILWSLEKEEPAARAGMLNAFQKVLLRARDLHVPVVGYISAPGGKDVVNALRVRMCPLPVVSCKSDCPAGDDPTRRSAPCGALWAASDASIFRRSLEQGSRSALFATASKVADEYDAAAVPRFCYVRAGDDVARLEVPAYVAEDAGMMDLVQSAVIDQVSKGGGYPVALSEAHEAAVVRGPDRDLFYHLLARELARAGVPVRNTRKALAKRVRGV